MKITKFFIDNAIYKAVDDSGREISLEIDYWNNSFKISNRNRSLESAAKDLLKRKHKVNFVDKLINSSYSSLGSCKRF